jgi:hypothetical protein
MSSRDPSRDPSRDLSRRIKASLRRTDNLATFMGLLFEKRGELKFLEVRDIPRPAQG